MATWMIAQSLDSFVTSATCVGYLDPGTGSYALQLILAGLFGSMFVLKQTWQQCRSWISQVRLGRQ